MIQERVKKEKYYIILKMLHKEDYIDTLKRVNVSTEEEVEKILRPDLSSALRESTVKEKKKKISKNIIITK